MASRTPVTIDDPGNDPGNGDNEFEGRKPQPTRDVPKVAGFDLHSPGEFVDGGTDDYGGAGSDGPKRRGRKPGSKNRASTEAKTAHNLGDGIERLLLSIHAMGSVFLHCPELELDPTEAKILASSIKDLSKHYQVTLDPKRLAIIEFSTVIATIYGLRGVAIYKRVKKESTSKPQLVTSISKPKAATGETVPPKQAASSGLTPSDVFGVNNGVEDLSQL
jgi:hypothetical protein